VVDALRVLIERGGFDVLMIQSVIDFVRTALRNTTDSALLAACLGLVGSLTTVSPNIIKKLLREILPILGTITDTGIPSIMPIAVDVMVLVITGHPAQSRATLGQVYPKFLQFARAGSDSRARAHVGEGIITLIDGYYKRREFPVAVSLITLFLNSRDDVLLLSATRMILSLLKSLDRPVIAELFLCLARATLAISDEWTLNSCVDTLRRILKQHPVNATVVMQFSCAILNEGFPLFEKQALPDWICPQTSLFAFLTLAIERYSKVSAPLIPWLTMLVTNSSDAMFTVIFDPIAAAYGVGLVTQLPSQRLYEVCYRDVFTHHNTIALSYLLEKVTDHVADFVAALCREWRGIKKSMMLWRCAVSAALFQLAARGQKVELDILQLILEEFPYKADLGFGESLCRHIIDAFEKNPDVEPIELTLLKKFADFFMLEHSDFLAHHIPYDLQIEMKAIMRKIYKKNKQYEKEMLKYYARSKTKINKFALLIQ
jgi:hypothetical protein